VSEAIRSFGIFASFKSQNALATHEDANKACRPFDRARNGIVVSEGGCLYVLERLEDAQRRGARIYAEVVGYAINTDATDFVLPNPERQAQCMTMALRRAGLAPDAIDLISTHGTATPEGDPKECEAIRAVFGPSPTPYVNNTKCLIGHAMGAAGALELAGNLPGLEDHMVHPTVNCEDLDSACALPNLVVGQSRRAARMDTILNNSFGMLGINAVVIVRRPPAA
jgi:3-oxoacyl-[acyl-carrier-protein] synthase II